MPSVQRAAARSSTPATASWRPSCRRSRRFAAPFGSARVGRARASEQRGPRQGANRRRGGRARRESPGSLHIDGSARRAALCARGARAGSRIERGGRAVPWKGPDVPGPGRSFTQGLRSPCSSSRCPGSPVTNSPAVRLRLHAIGGVLEKCPCSYSHPVTPSRSGSRARRTEHTKRSRSPNGNGRTTPLR